MPKRTLACIPVCLLVAVLATEALAATPKMDFNGDFGKSAYADLAIGPDCACST